MTTINQILEHPEILNTLADNEIRAMVYAIKFFDLDAAYTRWNKPVPTDADETLRQLQEHLAKLEQPATEDTTIFITCSCGHMVESALVMSSSRGSSCPDCYDRMSD